MGENGTRLAALLFDMQKNIRDEIGADIRESEGRLSQQISDLREDHGRRLSALERRGGAGLTKAQRRALWAILSGLTAEVASHARSILTGAQKLFHLGNVRP